jgi:glycosyltransferase involved in cell wall biosynthesis
MVFQHAGPVGGIEEDPSAKPNAVFPPQWHVPRAVVWLSVALLSYVLKRVPRVIFVGDKLRDVMTRVFKLDPQKVEVIHNGVDVDVFKPGQNCAGLREKILLKGGPVVGCVARIAPYKNQLTLVKAVPHIIRAYPTCRFVLVGPIADASYYAQIKDFVRACGIEQNVIFVGLVDRGELPSYYDLFDVFVLLSTGEGLAISLLEAMSCGKPFVCSNISQNREVAIGGEAGEFVDPFDEVAVADAIVRALSDRSLSEKRGLNARETVLRHFDLRLIAREVATVYESLIPERARLLTGKSPIA